MKPILTDAQKAYKEAFRKAYKERRRERGNAYEREYSKGYIERSRRFIAELGDYQYNIEVNALVLTFLAIKRFKNRELVAAALGISSRTLSSNAHVYGFGNFKAMREEMLRLDNPDELINLYIRKLESDETDNS